MTDNGISGLEMCPPWAPALGFAGATLALVFTCVGSAYGTGKAAQGISAVGVSKPEVRAQPHTLTALRTRDTVSRVVACCCLVLSRRAVPRVNEEPPCSPEPREARPTRQPACYLPPDRDEEHHPRRDGGRAGDLRPDHCRDHLHKG